MKIANACNQNLIAISPQSEPLLINKCVFCLRDKWDEDVNAGGW